MKPIILLCPCPALRGVCADAQVAVIANRSVPRYVADTGAGARSLSAEYPDME